MELINSLPLSDLHAENYYPQSPYSFAGNNPVKNVDTDGRDYYQSAGGSVIWQDDNARKVVIDGEKYKNIGASYSTQMGDGSYANYYQGQFISTSTEAVNARQTILENPALAGALLSSGSPISSLSQQGLMADMIHQAQENFIQGVVEFGSTALQRGGDAITTVGYGASASGIGIEAGAPLVVVGNAMKYTGVGIEAVIDYSIGNYRKVGYTGFTNTAMGVIGAAGSLTPGPIAVYYNLLLMPFNVALDYGGSTIKPKKNNYGYSWINIFTACNMLLHLAYYEYYKTQEKRDR